MSRLHRLVRSSVATSETAACERSRRVPKPPREADEEADETRTGDDDALRLRVDVEATSRRS